MRTFLAISLLLASCGDEEGGCPAIAAASGLSIYPTPRTWDPHHTYDLSVETDSSEAWCKIELPAEGAVADCSDGAYLVLDSGGDNIQEMFVQDFFEESFTFRVAQDGFAQFDDTVEATYVTDQPDGPECEERKLGEVTVEY